MVPGENAEGDRRLCGQGGHNIRNAYGMTFNHEGATHSHLFTEGRYDDLYYTRDGFLKFKERYQQRIQNFRAYIDAFNEIVLVHHNFEKTEEGSLNICIILRERHPRKRFIHMSI